MSLVTVQRSPTPSENGLDQTDFERCSPTFREETPSTQCYFYVKGTAVILLQPDRTNVMHHSAAGEIEEHLQAMLRILPPRDTLTMAVRLQVNSDLSSPSSHARYLAVVVSTHHHDDSFRKLREVVLLGVDCISHKGATIGVAIPVYASTCVRLDGDGGVVVDFDSSFHLFRPISVQAMWTMFQCLHKELIEAQSWKNSVQQFGRSSRHLIDYYRSQVSLDDNLRAQWERSTLDCSSDGDLSATCADAERFGGERFSNDTSIEARIYEQLKEVMQTVDLDEVTSKDIRKKVEENMSMNLDEYKDFISRQVMVIMGQMDKASQIFPYLYLGTEWNACDWQWLENNRIEYIVNVTNEVENFFPARLNYLKIRVSDEASSELLRYWNQTNQFIKEAKEKGSAVLVHCKKGISRSSSTVIAFAMKEYGWALSEAMEHVKKKRDCITPNKGFVEQLRTFEGMIHAFKKRGQFDVSPSTSMEPPVLIRQQRRMRERDQRITSASSVLTHNRTGSETVRSLVGSFEAIGRSDRTRDDSRRDRPPVTFRLRNISDWKIRDRFTVPVSNTCANAPMRQARALTISQ